MKSRPVLRILARTAPIALLVLGFWAVSSRPPRLPDDRDHDLAQAEGRCLSCHGHGARRPRPAAHPSRDDCFSCHRDAAGVLHPRRGAPTSIPGGWADDPRQDD